MADSRRVVVVQTTPTNDAREVSLKTDIRVTLNQPVDPSTVNPATLTLFSGIRQVGGSTRVEGNTAIFTPTAPLNPLVIYRATLSQRVKTKSNRGFREDFSWEFQTRLPRGPIILERIPSENASGILPDQQIQVVFDEEIDPATVNGQSFYLSQDQGPGACSQGTIVPSVIDVQDNTIRLTPMLPLEVTQNGAETLNYSVTLRNSLITDLDHDHVSQTISNPVVQDECWRFSMADLIAPRIVSVEPAHLESGVNVQLASIQVQWNEPVDPTSLGGNLFTLTGPDEFLVPGTPVPGPNANTAVFSIDNTAEVGLVPNTTFAFRVDPGVRDSAGNISPETWTSTFTTSPGWARPRAAETAPEAASFPILRYDSLRNQYQAMWLQSRPGTSRPGVFTRTFGSNPFAPAIVQEVDTNFSSNCSEPRMVVNPHNGEVHYFWLQQSSLWHTRRSNNGVLGTPVAIDLDGPDSFLIVAKPQVAVSPNGSVWASFSQDSEVWVRRYIGEVWEDPVSVGLPMSSGEYGPGFLTQITTDALNRVYVAFEQTVEAQVRNGFFITRLDNELTGIWETPARIDFPNGTDFPVNSQQIAVAPDGTAYVIFLQKGLSGTGFTPSVFVSRRAPMGGWQPAIVLDLDGLAGDLTCAAPQIVVVPEGVQHRAYAFFFQLPSATAGGVFNLYSTRLNSVPGSNWESPVAIDVDGSAVGLRIQSAVTARAAVSSHGRLCLLFLQRETTVATEKYRLFAVRREIGGNWEPPIRIDAFDTTIYEAANIPASPIFAIAAGASHHEFDLFWQQSLLTDLGGVSSLFTSFYK